MAARKGAGGVIPRRRSGGTSRRWLGHRNLVAAEALLIAGLCKDWITTAVQRSDLAAWGKVLFVMGATVGLFGGLFFALERLLERGVSRTHSAVGGLPLPVPSFGAHALVLLALFLVYARHLGLPVW